VAQIVALADKSDTLAGIFGLGMKPTGAKDPFGLRRASLGIVRIIVEKQLDLDLDALLEQAITVYSDRLDAPDKAGMLAYVIERLRGYLLDTGYAADAIDAVLAKDLTRPLDIVARLDAMQQFRSTDAAVSLAAASKRIGNLLRKVEGDIAQRVDEKLLQETAESALHNQVTSIRPLIEQQLHERDYRASMQTTSTLREPVDTFFDEVMVMDENETLRANRLALLRQVNELCCSTAELSLLKPAEATANHDAENRGESP
jgi:glycyl-tRNA synthetase beta chain